MKFKQFLLLITVAIISPLVHASIVHDNGAPSTLPGYCVSSSCGGTGSVTLYDQFVVNSDTTVTGFADWVIAWSGQYSSTNWSIWSTTPSLTGTPIASGSSTAVISSNSGYNFMIVKDLSIDLSAGTYWLGINHQLNGVGYWASVRAESWQSNTMAIDSNGNVYTNLSDTAFIVNGPVVGVPEPETYAMLLAGLGLIGLATRRRLKV